MADTIKVQTPQNAIHDAIRVWIKHNGIYDVGGFLRFIHGSYRNEIDALEGDYIVKAYLDHVRKMTGENHAIEFDNENNCWRVFASF